MAKANPFAKFEKSKKDKDKKGTKENSKKDAKADKAKNLPPWLKKK